MNYNITNILFTTVLIVIPASNCIKFVNVALLLRDRPQKGRLLSSYEDIDRNSFFKLKVSGRTKKKKASS